MQTYLLLLGLVAVLVTVDCAAVKKNSLAKLSAKAFALAKRDHSEESELEEVEEEVGFFDFYVRLAEDLTSVVKAYQKLSDAVDDFGGVHNVFQFHDQVIGAIINEILASLGPGPTSGSGEGVVPTEVPSAGPPQSTTEGSQSVAQQQSVRSLSSLKKLIAKLSEITEK